MTSSYADYATANFGTHYNPFKINGQFLKLIGPVSPKTGKANLQAHSILFLTIPHRISYQKAQQKLLK